MQKNKVNLHKAKRGGKEIWCQIKNGSLKQTLMQKAYKSIVFWILHLFWLADEETVQNLFFLRLWTLDCKKKSHCFKMFYHPQSYYSSSNYKVCVCMNLHQT